MTGIVDALGRGLRDLRISVTDRCNLRCRYCMPKEVFGREHVFIAREDLLSFDEIARLSAVFAGLGVDKLRLTGGEPLLRRDLEGLVEMLVAIEGIHEVALTTNGTLLASRAQRLARAGLSRVTVSLDGLDQRVFGAISDTKLSLSSVLDGVEAAAQAGLSPVKINMVVRRGVNDGCVLEMAEHFRHRPEVLRFIEYMDVGHSNGWQPGEVVPAYELIETIETRWALEPLAPARPGEVASRWRYRDKAGEIGFIRSISSPFCADCVRARLAADGQLYTCLFATHGHDLRALLRGGARDREIRARIAEIWTGRRDRYCAERASPRAREAPAGRARGSSTPPARGSSASIEPRVEMSRIGG